MSKPFLGAREPRALPYVVNSRGEHILVLHRFAEAHEQHEREHDAQRVRRPA